MQKNDPRQVAKLLQKRGPITPAEKRIIKDATTHLGLGPKKQAAAQKKGKMK